MIMYNWKDFVTEAETFTQRDFEHEVNDRFEAVLFEEGKTIPSYIWTTNFVVIIKPNSRMYTDVSFVKVPRNPIL